MTQNNTAEFKGTISNAKSKPIFVGMYNLKEEPESKCSEECNDISHIDLDDTKHIKIEEKDIKVECLGNEVEDPIDTRSLEVRRGKICLMSIPPVF